MFVLFDSYLFLVIDLLADNVSRREVLDDFFVLVRQECCVHANKSINVCLHSCCLLFVVLLALFFELVKVRVD